jgi:hypothetical protein
MLLEEEKMQGRGDDGVRRKSLLGNAIRTYFMDFGWDLGTNRDRVDGKMRAKGGFLTCFKMERCMGPDCRNEGRKIMAERAGFEPASPLPGYTLSKRAP